MATLEKIRSQAGLLVIVVGLALFAFIIGDFLNSGSTYRRQNQDQVVNVNGTIVNYQAYHNRIEELTKIYKIQLNANNLNDEQLTQVRQGAYDGLVNEIVINDELNKLSIIVTPEELFDMVQGENISPFAQQFPLFTDPQTGMFDKMRALNILKTIESLQNQTLPQEYWAEVEQIRDYWLFWERNMKMQALQNKYAALLSKVVVANPLEAKDSYESSLENSDIVYVMQSFSTIPDSTVKVSDSDLKKLYNQRKEQYKQKETRIIDYIVVEFRPSQEDYEGVQADANRIYDEIANAEVVEEVVNANSEIPFWNAFISENGLDTDMKAFVEKAAIGDMEGPLFREDSYRIFKLIDKKLGADSVNVSHIFLADQSLSKEQLEAMADSLAGVLKAGGNFEELAAQYSADQTAQRGGEIGWMTEMDALRYFGEEFKDAIFVAAVNQPLVLVSTYGVHVLKVTEKTAIVPKYKIAYVHLSVTPSSKTFSNLYSELNQFISINNTGEKMEAAAADAGYVLNLNISISAADRAIGMVPDARQAVRWVYESNKKGEISSIIECRNHFIVAIRKGVMHEGYQAIQYVSPLLRSELASRIKGEQIATELNNKNLRTIEAYAEAIGTLVDTVRFINFSTPRITGIGSEPKLNAAITFAPLYQVSEPVAGNNGVYVFNVIDRSKDEIEYDEQAEILKLESANSYRAAYTTFQSLMDKAKITDNRIRFE